MSKGVSAVNHFPILYPIGNDPRRSIQQPQCQWNRGEL